MRIQEEHQRRRLGRRRLLGLAGGAVAATMLGPWSMTGSSIPRARSLPNFNPDAGFGALDPDPKGRLALPQGFQSRELSPEGGKLSNGANVPGWHDGIAAFACPNGTTILVRNHEIATEPSADSRILGVPRTNPYATDAFGGTTAVIVGAGRTASARTGSGPRNRPITSLRSMRTIPRASCHGRRSRKWVSSPTRRWVTTRTPATPT